MSSAKKDECSKGVEIFIFIVLAIVGVIIVTYVVSTLKDRKINNNWMIQHLILEENISLLKVKTRKKNYLQYIKCTKKEEVVLRQK